jgi:benzoyl-CoA 2,3-dioxygenase component B
MLTEEAHHMFVGEAGISRVIQRTCEVREPHRRSACLRAGVTDCRRRSAPNSQRTLDLFGADDHNAAIHGRPRVRADEATRGGDHRRTATHEILEVMMGASPAPRADAECIE